MEYKAEKFTSNGVPMYKVYGRLNFFHKWKQIEFTIEDTGEKASELTIDQISCTSSDLWVYFSDEIRDDIHKYEDKKEVEHQLENVYEIFKYKEPGCSRVIEPICGAKEIGDLSDGYHTFNELYDFRREYNAALVNSGVWPAHKSHRHHDGELCFGGGWFIVMIDTPFGQISNHYEDKYWDEFHCKAKKVADEWDGHTEKDVIERLMKCNKKK